jgi:hypothetical protein
MKKNLSLIAAIIISVSSLFFNYQISKEVKGNQVLVRESELREYQMEIVEDSVLIFDRNRHVQTLSIEDGSTIGEALLNDNL